MATVFILILSSPAITQSPQAAGPEERYKNLLTESKARTAGYERWIAESQGVDAIHEGTPGEGEPVATALCSETGVETSLEVRVNDVSGR